MAVAAPFVPMMIGAGVGAIMDKGNPLRGAMLGAVGGTVAGPAMAGLTAGGSAAAGMAGAAGAAPGAAASYGAAGALAGIGPEQAAMLAAQTGEFGTAGLSSTLSSAGMNPMLAKGASLATMGPQGMIQAMGNGPMGLKDVLGMGQKGMGLISKLGGGQPQGGAPAAMAAPSRPMPAPQQSRMQPFQTGPVIGARPNGPMIRGMR